MTPARLQAVEEIFHAALDREPDQVGEFLDVACKDDAVLRRKVEALLTSHQEAGGFIEISPAGIATRIIESGQEHLLVGRIIGHYKLSRRIGAGGMGEVYLATDITAGRKAALKLLPARFTSDVERLKRFQQEAHALVGLNHPNILTVYEIGEERSVHYIASELIEGETLRQRLTRRRMELGEAVDVAIQAANALVAAHETDIVHRDIKPENIMLRRDGYVKVLDFGIAKLAEPAFADPAFAAASAEWAATADRAGSMTIAETNLGSILGTVRYMSPEQAHGRSVDKRTDIWSLGVVLYEMVTGHVPFTGNTPIDVMTSILEEQPPLLRSYIKRAPAELQQIISKTLRKDRSERYQNAGEVLQALKNLRRKLESKVELVWSSAPSWLRWTRSPTALVLGSLVAALALAFLFFWDRNSTRSLIPEKSIAVLPFENFSDNKENSYFAAGIQDDVLTSLAQIHDLKVISRTSVMDYQKRGERNIREISQALGVANVLEGSVRRAGNRVLVNVQLIDARNDRHLWAERYDRTVADSIGLQGELATQIAAALKTTLAREETARFAVKPTANSEAYVLYLTALGKEGRVKQWPEDAIAAEELYAQAAAVDPTFALAYARASLLNSIIASYGQYPSRKAKARAQAEEALRLAPSLGEAHMALGLCLYWGEKHYDAALKEFQLAAASSPNNAEIYNYVGGIYRRQGRWREAVASYERALSLDPRNASIANFAGNNYLYVRDWAAAGACYNHALEIKPDSVHARIGLACLEVFRNANPAAGRRILENIPARLDSHGEVALTRWDLAMLERDYAAAEKILSDLPVEKFQASTTPKTYYQGRTALARGDKESAQRYFAATIPALEKWVRDAPDRSERHSLIGLLYAYMHRNEDAIREARRAVELEPESQDAFHGAMGAAHLAMVYALIGEQDPAITLIERLLSTPGPFPGPGPDYPSDITLADLRLRWEWDSLRSNPRFQKILAGPEPKTNLTSITPAAPAAPEKSIAVLPFENLSDDKQNAYFAAGVQDEILTDLARVADLKVTSRTSVRFYEAGKARNSREIGQELGVAHLLEGSVQRDGNRLRINAQLIDARTDSHLWGQTYDREIADLFAIQDEIAQTIANQLQAKMSASEKTAIAQPATTDLLANDLYLQAVALEFQPPGRENLPRAVSLLEQAVGRDSHFLRAYCALSRMHFDFYENGYDHTAARLAMARNAIEKAAQLQPDAGEVHLAWAHYYFGFGVRDYDRAREELELARRTLPNDPAVYDETAYVDRRQGRWTEAVRNLERAVELDPRNAHFLRDLAGTCNVMHRYTEGGQFFRRLLVLSPRDYWARISLAAQAFHERADAGPLRAELNAILKEEPGAAPKIAGDLWSCALYERDAAAADRALAAIPPEGLADNPELVRPREWHVGYVARIFNRPESARAAFTTARTILEKLVREQPGNASAWRVLGRVDAALGRKEEAIKAGRHACDLLPLSREPTSGLWPLFDLARIYAWVGEKDLALQLLGAHAGQIGGPSYGVLKLDPDWDPLRGDPRFEKIVASLAPK